MNHTDALHARDNRTPPNYTPDANGRLCCIVPSFNYGRFIEKALDSILAQTRPADEVIVIDDGSKDGTMLRLEQYRGQVRIVQTPRNLGLPAVRNRAIAMTDAEFIVSIDADDWCEPTYFETLVGALKADPKLGVAYTSVKSWDSTTNTPYVHRTWPPPFVWDLVAVRSFPPRTMIPASAMYRREMWRRAGGFMESLDRAEDAEFWLRGLSVGFNVRKVTEENLYTWRYHGTNASNDQPDNDVHAWLPWLWRGDAPSGAPTPKAMTRDYTKPSISVVITIGPKHGKYAAAAIESVIGQTFWNWQLVIVNDTGEDLDVSRYPFAIDLHTDGGIGASAARNFGMAFATAPFITFLDGDDFLHPFALQRMAEMWARVGHGFVYTDLFEWHDGERPNKPVANARQLHTADPNVLQFYNGITTLMLKCDAERVGGFDENMRDGGEDKDFYLKLRAIGGVHAHRLGEPLFYYRIASGFLRNRSGQTAISKALDELFDARYGAYIRGEKTMASCCGGSAGEHIIELKRALQGLPPASLIPTVNGMVMMQFTGNETGEITYTGLKGRRYPAANNDTNRFVNVHPDDVEKLLNIGKFVVATATMPPEPRTMPIVATEPLVDPFKDRDADEGMPASLWTRTATVDDATLNAVMGRSEVSFKDLTALADEAVPIMDERRISGTASGIAAMESKAKGRAKRA
jgi:glycosyltransferase involved in cell wall biosynthesis